jgi:hypothetical protein
MGSVCQEREEIAKILIPAFEHHDKCILFLQSICSNEIRTACKCTFIASYYNNHIQLANDYQTLFRANSMASKAVDIYMKHVASKYLKCILGPVLYSIVHENLDCEVSYTMLISY